VNQHEEGGYIYWNPDTNKFRVRRFEPGKPRPPGTENRLRMPEPPPPEPEPGEITVGYFHTHPPNLGLNCEGKLVVIDENQGQGTGDSELVQKYRIPDLIATVPRTPKDLKWHGNPYFPKTSPPYPNRLK
jgi:hypothetical protein